MDVKLTFVLDVILIAFGIYSGFLGEHAHAAASFSFVAAMNTVPWPGKK